MTLLYNRLEEARSLRGPDALFFVRCDYHGSSLVPYLLYGLGLELKAEVIVDRSRNEAGSPNKMEITYEHLFMSGWPDRPVKKYTIPRSVANISWTGFLMAGDRHPAERVFLGKTLMPPSGQHFSLRQEKVDKLLSEFHLRLRCRDCGAIYFRAENTQGLEREMKKPENRFKFYDVTAQMISFGVLILEKSLA